MANRYKWRLTWSGRSNTKALQSAVEHCSTYTLFCDSDARLIDYEEYQALIQLEEIRLGQSWWRIKPNQVGLITLSTYAQYAATWDAISLCQVDFLAGYQACEKHKK